MRSLDECDDRVLLPHCPSDVSYVQVRQTVPLSLIDDDERSDECEHEKTSPAWLTCFTVVVYGGMLMVMVGGFTLTLLLLLDRSVWMRPTPPPPPPRLHFRTLLVMADNRELDFSPNNAIAMAAYINYQYTRLHSDHMDFRFVRHHLNHSSLIINQPLSSDSHKMAPSCYNPALDQYRAAP